MGYLYRAIAADRDVEVPVVMGSDDGLRLWLNGELLVDENHEQAMDPQAYRRVLKLKKGVNHLLVKVSQGHGEWQFQMSEEVEMDPSAEAALDYQLDQDFPDAESRYYRLVSVAPPRGGSVEGGGLDLLPSGGPTPCPRRGGWGGRAGGSICCHRGIRSCARGVGMCTSCGRRTTRRLRQRGLNCSHP